MQQLPARCPRCRTGTLRPNEDGDWACMCGHVVYRERVAARPPALVATVASPAPLSPRHQETLQLLAKGMTNREIAREMGVTVMTVKGNLRDMKDRLGVETREDLQAYAKGAEGRVGG